MDSYTSKTLISMNQIQGVVIKKAQNKKNDGENYPQDGFV